jgi:hypothetical protein
MCDTVPETVTHFIIANAKCTTICLGISLEGFTYRDPGANTDKCPSWQAGQAVSDALPNPGCSFLSGGMKIIWVNARVICKNDGKGHFDKWTEDEAILVAKLLVVFCMVCALWGIPVFLPNFGGTIAALKCFGTFSDELTRVKDYQELKESISRLISMESR